MERKNIVEILYIPSKFIYRFFLLTIFLLECLISRSLVLQNIVSERDYGFSVPLFFLNSILTILFITQWIEKGDGSIAGVLIVSYILKLFIILQKEFITETVLYSDMEDYQNAAILFFYYGTPLHRGTWSAAALFMGLIYKIFGIQTLLLRHFNLTMILISGLAVYRILHSFHVPRKIMQGVLLWIQWSPYLVNNSTTIHREAMINVSIAVSFLFFIRWFQEGRLIHFILTIILILPAIMLHAGTFGVSVGYILVMIFYSPKEKKVRFGPRSVMIAAILIGGIMAMYLEAFPIFFQKFSGRTLEKIIEGTERAEGGSYYSIGLHISTLQEMILYTPLRIVYFYLSPMPWDWRGLRDAMGFCISGLLYTLVFTQTLREISQKKKNRIVVAALLVIMLAFGVIFGWGVKNAGTAIRHRDKAISIAAVMLALCLDDIGTVSNRRRIKLSIWR